MSVLATQPPNLSLSETDTLPPAQSIHLPAAHHLFDFCERPQSLEVLSPLLHYFIATLCSISFLVLKLTTLTLSRFASSSTILISRYFPAPFTSV